MTMLGRNLGVNLAHMLGKSCAGESGSSAPLLSFDDLVYVNASPRYLLDPVTPQVLGPFAPNVLAEAVIGGKRYGQFEGEALELCKRSHEFDLWTAAAVVTPDVAAGPTGEAGADRITFDATPGNYCYLNTPGFGNNDHVICRVWARTETGTKAFRLAFQRDGTQYDSSNFTATTTWQSFELNIPDIGAGSAWYLKITNCSTGGAGSVLAWGYNCRRNVGFMSSDIKTTGSQVTRPADSAYWPSAVVPAGITSGKWTFNVVMFSSSAETADGWLWNWSGDPGGSGLNWAGGGINAYGSYPAGISSNVLTWARYAVLTVTIDIPNHTMEISGAASGNGVTSGTAPNWVAKGNLIIGGNARNYLLSQPEAA